MLIRGMDRGALATNPRRRLVSANGMAQACFWLPTSGAWMERMLNWHRHVQVGARLPARRSWRRGIRNRNTLGPATGNLPSNEIREIAPVFAPAVSSRAARPFLVLDRRLLNDQ